MKIYGIQRLSLVDWNTRAVCTLFTGGCNFDCPFCHNSTLLKQLPQPLDEDEVFSYLEKRKNLLDGVCVTGGEPLMHRDAASLFEKLHAIGYAVKLDTNGSFTGRLKELLDAKLCDYVAMDIKNTPEKYSMTCGRDVDTDAVFRSAELLMKGSVPFEFRTTLVPEYHTTKDFCRLGELLRGDEKYFLQAFKTGETVRDKSLTPPTDEYMEECLLSLRQLVPNSAIRGK